jgi:hypothetical protein
VTQLRRFISFILVVFGFATIQASGQVCSQAKYQNTLACLPSTVANKGLQSYIGLQDPSSGTVYFDPTTAVKTTKVAVPLGIGYQYASQIATSPSAATSAGYLFTMTSTGLSAKPADFAPLLSDLPQTLGRKRVYIGTSWQWMELSKTGGKDHRSFEYSQGFQDPVFYSSENLMASMSVRMHSINTYIAVGLTDHIDISAVIPWSRVSMSFHTTCYPDAQGILTTSGVSTNDCFYYGDTGYSYNGQEIMEVNTLPRSNSGVQESSGIGDVTLRGKWEFLRKGQNAVAGGVEVRLPTGSPLNFQGSGAVGIRPFVTWAYDGRISPHFNIGYQYNGSSVNDVHDTLTQNNNFKNGDYFGSEVYFNYSNTVPSSKLPNIYTTSFGADFAVNSRLNIDVDILDRTFSNDGSKAFQAAFPKAFGNQALLLNVDKENGTEQPLFEGASQKLTAVVGAKTKLAGHLLFSANVAFDATNNGMSYKPSPIATLSYDFGGSAEK